MSYCYYEILTAYADTTTASPARDPFAAAKRFDVRLLGETAFFAVVLPDVLVVLAMMMSITNDDDDDDDVEYNITRE